MILIWLMNSLIKQNPAGPNLESIASPFPILDRNEQEAAAACAGRPRDVGELRIRVRLRREFLFLIVFPLRNYQLCYTVGQCSGSVSFGVSWIRIRTVIICTDPNTSINKPKKQFRDFLLVTVTVSSKTDLNVSSVINKQKKRLKNLLFVGFMKATVENRKIRIRNLVVGGCGSESVSKRHTGIGKQRRIVLRYFMFIFRRESGTGRRKRLSRFELCTF